MFTTLRLRHFFGAIALVLGVATLAFAAITIENPHGACALDEIWDGGGWATVRGPDGTSACQDLAPGGLLWSSSAIGRTESHWSYDYAVIGCRDLVEAGYSDWRLPAAKEVQTAASHNAIDHISITWTDVTDPNNPYPLTAKVTWAIEKKGTKATWANLADGGYSLVPKKSQSDYRCVRP